MNLRTRPGTSLVVAAAREDGGGAGRARAAEGGAGVLEAGTGTRGSREGAGSLGVGPRVGLAGLALTDRGARPVRHREEAGRRGLRGACWEKECQH